MRVPCHHREEERGGAERQIRVRTRMYTRSLARFLARINIQGYRHTDTQTQRERPIAAVVRGPVAVARQQSEHHPVGQQHGRSARFHDSNEDEQT